MATPQKHVRVVTPENARAKALAKLTDDLVNLELNLDLTLKEGQQIEKKLDHTRDKKEREQLAARHGEIKQLLVKGEEREKILYEGLLGVYLNPNMRPAVRETLAEARKANPNFTLDISKASKALQRELITKPEFFDHLMAELKAKEKKSDVPEIYRRLQAAAHKKRAGRLLR